MVLLSPVGSGHPVMIDDFRSAYDAQEEQQCSSTAMPQRSSALKRLQPTARARVRLFVGGCLQAARRECFGSALYRPFVREKTQGVRSPTDTDRWLFAFSDLARRGVFFR